MAGDDRRQLERQLADYRRKVAELEDELGIDHDEPVGDAEASDHPPTAREAMLAAERVASMANLARAIAHEINNPLATCVGYLHQAVKLAGRAEPDSELVAILERVEHAAHRIGGIIGELQMLSEEIVGEREKLDLASVVTRVGTLVPPELREHMRLELDPVRVCLDRPRLYQLVYNMIMPYLLAARYDDAEAVVVHCGKDGEQGALVEVLGGVLPHPGTRTDLLAAIRGEYPGSTLPLRLARSLALEVGGQWQEGPTDAGHYRTAVSLPRA